MAIPKSIIHVPYQLRCHGIMRSLLLFMLLFSTGCRENPEVSKEGTSGDAAQTTSSASSTIISDEQAQAIGDFEFRDQNGVSFSRSSIVSKLTVVNFIFTTCPGTCPRQSDAMKTLQERIQKVDTFGAVRLVSITVNPEFDTAEVLKEYAEQYSADPTIWSFLTGGQEEIWRFSKDSMKLPVAANPTDPLIPIAHESKFVLIDREGKIRGYFDCLNEKGFNELWTAMNILLPEFTPDAELLTHLRLPEDVGHIAQPANILEGEWLFRLAEKEKQALLTAGVAPNLNFTQALASTGITFSPQIVDDQRHRLLVNHYDHGNSISVADIDNDGLLDIYFTSQVGPNELWRNTGEGVFENVTESAGVGLPDRLSVAGSFCDTDNDGDVDLFVTSIRDGNVLLENDGKGKFTDVTVAAGLDYRGHSSKGTFFDYDRDGLPDMFLSNVGKFTTEEHATVRHDLANSQPETDLQYYVGRPDAFSGHLSADLTEGSRLYRNLGSNRFEDVTEATGIGADSSWSGEAIIFDINHDNWPDVFVCNMQGHDHLYVNNDGKTFTDRTNEYFKKTPWGTMGAAVADFDNNGLFDLFLTDMHSDMSVDVGPDQEKEKSKITWPEEFVKSDGRSIYGNAFYRQTEAGQFQEISDEINAENYWPWGLSSGDFDADGFQDAFLCSSMCFPYRYGVNSLLWNSAGQKFLDTQFRAGIEPRPLAGRIAPWFSLDFSGQDSENRLRQGRDGVHLIWSATGTRSSAVFDYDDDGDLDIVTNEFNTSPQVFRNELSSVNYLKVKLTGSSSGRSALGAVVIVETKKGSQRQLNNGSTGYLSQSSIPLYFGLGEQTIVETVRIQWPNGQEQIVTGPINANQQIKVNEDE